MFSLQLLSLVTTTAHRHNTCPAATSLVCSYLQLFRAPAPQFPTFSLLNFTAAGAGGNGVGNVIGRLAWDQEAGCRGWKAEGCPGCRVIQAPAGTRCLWLDVSWQEQEEGRDSSSALCYALCSLLSTAWTHRLTTALVVGQLFPGLLILSPSQACKIPRSASAWFEAQAQKAETNTTSLLFPCHKVSEAHGSSTQRVTPCAKCPLTEVAPTQFCCIEELKVCAQTLAQPLNPQGTLGKLGVCILPYPGRSMGLQTKLEVKAHFFCYFSITLNKDRSIP